MDMMKPDKEVATFLKALSMYVMLDIDYKWIGRALGYHCDTKQRKRLNYLIDGFNEVKEERYNGQRQSQSSNRR